MRWEHRLDDAVAMVSHAAASIRDHVLETVDMQGSATLALGGGSPVPLLCEALESEPLPWSEMTVTLTDELWVPVEDEASHEGRLRRTLMTGEAAAARLVGLKTDAGTPEEAQDEIDATLAALAPFDVVVMTLDAAGGVASLLPDAPQIEAGIDLESAASVLPMRPPSSPHPRLTLTLAALLYSRRRYLLFTGDDKWDLYQRALVEGPVEELPVRGVLHPTSRALDVYWAP